NTIVWERFPYTYNIIYACLLHNKSNRHGCRKIKKKNTTFVVFFYGGEKGIRFSAEKPRRLQRATGTLPRAGFRIPL
ncbi:MAG: hypothetical protein IKU12_00880, partial [Oscillospiraceae bacterium]|nr:hypothetical protein [Oscillospiraceae bacterium]